MRAIRSISVMAIAIGALSGSSVGAAAQSEVTPRPPTEFSGHIECGPEVSHGSDLRETFGTGDGQVVRVTSRGWAWQPYPTTMSDPRLEGTYLLAFDADQVAPAGTSGPAVGSGTWRIVNDDGAWQGSFPIIEFPDRTTTVTTQLEGSGAYEGLTAIWESQHDARACSWEVRGVIIEGVVPPAPEPPAE
jgi:hypothetical protein